MKLVPSQFTMKLFLSATAQMPPFIDIEPHKAEILEFLSHNTQEGVIAMLSEKYHITLSRTSLQKRLRQWQSSVRTKKSDIYDRV
jgi:hypothetical protein